MMVHGPVLHCSIIGSAKCGRSAPLIMHVILVILVFAEPILFKHHKWSSNRNDKLCSAIKFTNKTSTLTTGISIIEDGG